MLVEVARRPQRKVSNRLAAGRERLEAAFRLAMGLVREPVVLLEVSANPDCHDSSTALRDAESLGSQRANGYCVPSRACAGERLQLLLQESAASETGEARDVLHQEELGLGQVEQPAELRKQLGARIALGLPETTVAECLARIAAEQKVDGRKAAESLNRLSTEAHVGEDAAVRRARSFIYVIGEDYLPASAMRTEIKTAAPAEQRGRLQGDAARR